MTQQVYPVLGTKKFPFRGPTSGLSSAKLFFAEHNVPFEEYGEGEMKACHAILIGSMQDVETLHAFLSKTYFGEVGEFTLVETPSVELPFFPCIGTIRFPWDNSVFLSETSGVLFSVSHNIVIHDFFQDVAKVEHFVRIVGQEDISYIEKLIAGYLSEPAAMEWRQLE